MIGEVPTKPVPVPVAVKAVAKPRRVEIKREMISRKKEVKEKKRTSILDLFGFKILKEK